MGTQLSLVVFPNSTSSIIHRDPSAPLQLWYYSVAQSKGVGWLRKALVMLSNPKGSWVTWSHVVYGVQWLIAQFMVFSHKPWHLGCPIHHFPQMPAITVACLLLYLWLFGNQDLVDFPRRIINYRSPRWRVLVCVSSDHSCGNICTKRMQCVGLPQQKLRLIICWHFERRSGGVIDSKPMIPALVIIRSLEAFLSPHSEMDLRWDDEAVCGNIDTPPIYSGEWSQIILSDAIIPSLSWIASKHKGSWSCKGSGRYHIQTYSA